MTETTYRVSIWQLSSPAKRRRHGVRWKTDTEEHSEWYPTKRLAESFRADLLRAQRAGEAFEVGSGLPVSMARKRASRTLLEAATAYVDWLWSSDAPPNTRKAAVTNLAAAIPLFVRQLDHGPDPALAQRLLATRVLPVPQRDLVLSPEETAVVSWLRRASRPLGDLGNDLTASELLRALASTATGHRVTSSTLDKRRAVLHRTLEFARAAGWVESNPLTGRRLTGETTGVQVVDPRVVVNPAQARQLLAAVTYVISRGRSRDPDRGARLRAFFACLYCGGLRPGEAQNLTENDMELPGEGWGRLLLAGARSEVSGSYYAGSGSRYHARPLKRRRPEEVRPVPIPPALVAILREHLEMFPTAPDGRLFFGAESAQNVPGSVTRGSGSRPGRSVSARRRRRPRSRVARTTYATRRCRAGSLPGSHRRRSPPGPGTRSRSC
ncbi:hypothetical protein [Pseudonocardia endophytica]|uniref:Phage integrase family protein n=1 Tax=Pseudonocardia endophytica TaxID=401976 RepID=A0A4R1HIE3_PSEEN|nr:hypothetical protein [Pseudonocardia endophytica]TCK20633.1 hypothetical protein EV378_4594 [Pseudonocardia endophytica]